MDNNWYRIAPSEYIIVAMRIPDAVQRAEFIYLTMICLSNGPLPDDDEEIAFVSGLPAEHVKALRPYLNRLSTATGEGQFMTDLAVATINEKKSFIERKTEAGRRGGEAKARKEKGKLAKPSSAKQCQDISSSAIAKGSIAREPLALLEDFSPERENIPSIENKEDSAKQSLAVLSSAIAKPSRPYPNRHVYRKTCNSESNGEFENGDRPKSSPLESALLSHCGFNEFKSETLSSLQYMKLKGAATRLTAAGITLEQIATARANWWGKSPPNFDQLADESLKVSARVSSSPANLTARPSRGDDAQCTTCWDRKYLVEPKGEPCPKCNPDGERICPKQ